MATLNLLIFALFFTCFISFYQSNAEPTQPFSSFHETGPFLNKTNRWSQYLFQSQEPILKLASPMMLAGFFCFIVASISSIGGIGGGGLFIPILTIVAGLDLKAASSFSAFMVTGGSIANVACNLFSSIFGGKALIDYDIALLSEPCMLLGVSVGVICHLVLPEWLVTVSFIVFLIWSTFNTCKNGVVHWNVESEEVKRNDYGNVEKGFVKGGPGIGNEVIRSVKEPLLDVEMQTRISFTWQKLGLLVLIWFSFSFLYLLRGHLYAEGIAPLQPCGVDYWVISALQIPLAIIFTAWILLKRKNCQNQTTNRKISVKSIDDPTAGRSPNKIIFPIMALLAGIFGGIFGIGGGMLTSPLLLHVGITPEVTAATCSFMVFFSSTMSAFQYILSGMEHTDTALVFAVICFVGSLVGLLIVQRIIQEYGRVSIIVFSVAVVMALSAILITSFAAIDVWSDYESGVSMGLKLPCLN